MDDAIIGSFLRNIKTARLRNDPSEELAEALFTDMPIAEALAGGTAGAIAGARASGIPPLSGAIIGGLAGAGLGAGGAAVGRKIRGRALLGRLRTGEGLTPTEERLFRAERKGEGDKRTFPVSRALTSPWLPAAALGVPAAAAGGALGYDWLSDVPPAKRYALAALISALSGGALGGLGYLGGRMTRYFGAREHQARRERVERGAPGWLTAEEKQVTLSKR